MSRKRLLFSIVLLIISLGLIYFGLAQTSTQIIYSKPQVAGVQNIPIASVPLNLIPTGFISAQVTRIVDGDTIEVSLNGQLQKLRYLGINTPETVDPRRPVQCFGHEASDANKNLLSSKMVYLEKDIEDKDKYDRILRYVYLPTDNGLLFVNDYLVRQGFAQLDTFPPNVKYVQRLTQAQAEARENNRGLWSKCNGKI